MILYIEVFDITNIEIAARIILGTKIYIVRSIDKIMLKAGAL